MSTRSLRLTLACLIAGVLGAGAPLAAQDAEQPQDRPIRYRVTPIVRVAQPYTLAAGDAVREVRVVFGDATIDGRVEHDVVVTMGSARVGPAAVIEGSLAVIGGSATVAEGAVVGRDLMVIGGTLNAPSAFSPGAYQIIIGSPWLGAMLDDVAPWMTRGLLWGRLIVPGLTWIWAVVGIFFLVYLVLNTVFDRAVGAAADVIGTRPLSTFMAGMLVLLLAAPVIALVAATVIGLLLVPFLVCALLVAALIGKVAVARAIGRTVTRSQADEGRAAAAMAFVIGFGLLTLAYMVPVIGFVTWALATVIGLGAATITFRGMLRRERPAPPPAPAPPRAPIETPYAAAVAAAPASANINAAPAEMGAAAAPVYTSGLAQYPRATFLDRVAAFALDAILIAIAGAAMDLERYDGLYPLALLAYHIAFWAWKGTTLGGVICSIRVVRTHGAELRPADAVVRGLASVFSLVALGIGCLWMLQDPESQMWHDKIAGTLVVKVPREMALP